MAKNKKSKTTTLQPTTAQLIADTTFKKIDREFRNCWITKELLIELVNDYPQLKDAVEHYNKRLFIVQLLKVLTQKDYKNAIGVKKQDA